VKSSDLNKTVLKKVLAKARSAKSPSHPEWNSDVEHLVYSYLLWNASVKQATAALKKLRATIVDYNELRIFLPVEIVDLIGPSYPHAMERADRMRSALRDIYIREHETTLTSLQDMGKRDVRRYIETLEGMVPFVAGRMLIYHYSVHQMPADDHLCMMFIEVGVVPDSADPEGVAAALTREVKADEAIDIHEGLVAAVEAKITSLRKAHKARVEARRTAMAPKPRPKKAPEKKAPEKKAAKKKAAPKKASAKSKTTSKSAAKKVTKRVTKKAATKKKVTKKVTRKVTKKATKKPATKKKTKKRPSRK
jgi:hypothetical protein